MIEIVGRFNVNFYSDCNIDDDGTKYHLLSLIEFDKNNKEIRQNSLYINHDSYTIANKLLKKEHIIEKLMNFKKNSKISFKAVVHVINQDKKIIEIF